MLLGKIDRELVEDLTGVSGKGTEKLEKGGKKMRAKQRKKKLDRSLLFQNHP